MRKGFGDSAVSEDKTLTVRVDPACCQGHNRCTALAPELFELDEFGYARARGDGAVRKQLREKAWLAQANCPELAIDIHED
jgi:ferredoxin